jgi:hypothetical protein
VLVNTGTVYNVLSVVAAGLDCHNTFIIFGIYHHINKNEFVYVSTAEPHVFDSCANVRFHDTIFKTSPSDAQVISIE